MTKMKELSHDEVYRQGGRIAKTAYLHPSVRLDLPVDISDNVTVYENSGIGRFTYINVGCVLYANSHIGRFCSVGRSVEIGLARHPIDYLSTHPFQCRNSLFNRYPGYAEIKRKSWQFHPPTHIGNDVWIGAKAGILSGVTVGDGAIIAAGTIVTKDVPPYAIVGGIPAKIIRYRFSESVIEDLLALKWWDLELADLQHLAFDDIEQCVAQLKAIRHPLAEKLAGALAAQEKSADPGG